MALDENCKQLAMLKELKDHHEELVKILGGEIAELSTRIFQEFMDGGTDQIRISAEAFKDGQARIIKPKLKYAPTVKDQEKFFTWLRETSHGSLIKETVHPKTLESFVTEQKTKKDGLLPSEAILAVFTVETAEIRRAPKSTN